MSPCSAPDLTVLPWSAGWLCSPPGLLQQTKIYSPFYFWEMGRQGGNFIQAFLPQSSFEKQQSQKRMRRNKQYTFLELRHPDRDRQAGRPSPTHRLHNPIAALIVSLFVSHPQDGWGCGKRWETAPQIHIPCYRTNQDSREGGGEKRRGTLHILVSLADSCSSLVQASHRDIHISTCLESTRCHGGHLPKRAASQSVSALAGLPLPHHLPISRHPAQGGAGPFISIKMWSPRSHSSCGPSPWPIPYLWLYFQTLTAQHPLTGCETTTKKQLRGNAGKGVV